MKNKKITYLLVLVAFAVWAYVFYSIFDYTSDDGAFSISTNKRNYTVDTIIKDDEHFTLLLNYTDPFLKTKHYSKSISVDTSVRNWRGSSKKIKAKSISEKPLHDPKDILFCKSVSYIGMIRNKQTNKNLAILNINSKEYMISEGQQIEDISVLKIVTDSVELKCTSMVLYIKKK